jgi:hypothetical protein
MAEQYKLKKRMGIPGINLVHNGYNTKGFKFITSEKSKQQEMRAREIQAYLVRKIWKGVRGKRKEELEIMSLIFC